MCLQFVKGTRYIQQMMWREEEEVQEGRAAPPLALQGQRSTCRRGQVHDGQSCAEGKGVGGRSGL